MKYQCLCFHYWDYLTIHNWCSRKPQLSWEFVYCSCLMYKNICINIINGVKWMKHFKFLFCYHNALNCKRTYLCIWYILYCFDIWLILFFFNLHWYKDIFASSFIQTFLWPNFSWQVSLIEIVNFSSWFFDRPTVVTLP